VSHGLLPLLYYVDIRLKFHFHMSTLYTQIFELEYELTTASEKKSAEAAKVKVVDFQG
jgi:hypothetical protein